MKKLLLFGLIILVFMPLPAVSHSQSTRQSNLKDRNYQELNLTDEQLISIKRIKSNYINRMLQLKTNLAGKQLEFRNMVGDPAISEEALKGKGREIEAINGQIIREMIGYELEVRRILKAEQIRLWSEMQDKTGKKNVRLP